MPANLDQKNYPSREGKPTIEQYFLMNFLNNVLVNWKSSFAGIGGIAGGVLAICNTLSDGFQTADWPVLTVSFGAISNGVSGLFGKSHDVSNAQFPTEAKKVN